MLPHHKDWAVKRSTQRMQQAEKDWRRGKSRGKTQEQIKERVEWMKLGGPSCGALQRLDVRIKDMVEQEDGTPYCNFQFRCLQCGSDDIRVPEDRAGDEVCCRSSCKVEIGTFRDLKSALTWLALDEWRYGEPEKFRRVSPLYADADGR